MRRYRRIRVGDHRVVPVQAPLNARLIRDVVSEPPEVEVLVGNRAVLIPRPARREPGRGPLARVGRIECVEFVPFRRVVGRQRAVRQEARTGVIRIGAADAGGRRSILVSPDERQVRSLAGVISEKSNAGFLPRLYMLASYNSVGNSLTFSSACWMAPAAIYCTWSSRIDRVT